MTDPQTLPQILYEDLPMAADRERDGPSCATWGRCCGETVGTTSPMAEGLWAELRDDGVDVLVSCAGATRTPNYLASEPEDANVPVQEPHQVAAETLDALGAKPTLFPARVLRFTHFAFRHLMGRRTAVRLMAYASNRTYKDQGSYRTGDRG